MATKITEELIGEVFDKVKSIYPDAIIAGGCMRDFLLGKEIKDIDIFTKKSPTGVYVVQLQELGFEIHNFISTDKYDNPGVQVEKYLYKNIEVDFIYIRTSEYLTVMDYVNRTFDYGICKVWFDGNKVITTKDFDEDRKNKTITLLTDNEGCHPKALEHYTRIKAKYPDYEGRIK